MLKELIKVANRLDSIGLSKEADLLDAIIVKMAANSLGDEVLKGELNYLVPVKSADWGWIIPTSWRLSKEHYSSISEKESSLDGIARSAGMAAFKIKKMCKESGADFMASSDRFVKLARESLRDYLRFASEGNDGQRFVAAGERKGGEHISEFKKSCEALMEGDRIEGEEEISRELRREEENINPY
jgi:hypothetical protein